MPWTPKDATRFTKKARTGKAKRVFAAVANSMLSGGASEGSAIRGANSAVKRTARKLRPSRRK